MRWLASAFLTNSTYIAVSGTKTGNSGLPVYHSNHYTVGAIRRQTPGKNNAEWS